MRSTLGWTVRGRGLALGLVALSVPLCLGFVVPARGAEAGSVVAACANPAIPAEILKNGTAAASVRAPGAPSTTVGALPTAAVVLAAASVAPSASSPPAPKPSPLAVVDATGAAKPLRLAVAADAPTRELGLMCVTALRPRHGMLFVFAQASPQPFWMKNTLIPLDMIWLDADGDVTSVAPDVPASTRTTPDADVARRSGYGRFVIELAAGEARADGIRTGVHFTLPALRGSP